MEATLRSGPRSPRRPPASSAVALIAPRGGAGWTPFDELGILECNSTL